MLQPRITPSLRRTLLNPTLTPLTRQFPLQTTLRPQHPRAFTSATHLRLAQPSPKPRQQQPQPQQSQPSQKPTPTQNASEKPDSKEDFVPRPLGRPIGFPYPPVAGQNTGAPAAPKEYKSMTVSERNIAKRMDLVEKFNSNYFRDFKNIRKYRKGKTFLANPRVFKHEAALYFPNLRGTTLEGKTADTTDVLRGRVSVVNVFSSEWGASQVLTFTGKEANPALHAVLDKFPGAAQMVDINIEENVLKWGLITLFRSSLRAKRKKEDWGKYFVVRKGVTDKIRETIGLLNGRVGYVYLLDEDCKIRWAGSADAEGTEMEDMNKGLQRLIDELGVSKAKLEAAAKSAEGQGKKASADEKPLPVPVPVVF